MSAVRNTGLSQNSSQCHALVMVMLTASTLVTSGSVLMVSSSTALVALLLVSIVVRAPRFRVLFSTAHALVLVLPAVVALLKPAGFSAYYYYLVLREKKLKTTNARTTSAPMLIGGRPPKTPCTSTM